MIDWNSYNEYIILELIPREYKSFSYVVRIKQYGSET